MAILKRRSRMISFRLSEDEYANLRSVCETEGARSVSDLARDAVHRLIRKDAEIPVENILRAIEGRLDTLDLQVQQLTAVVGQTPAQSMRLTMANRNIFLGMAALVLSTSIGNAQPAERTSEGRTSDATFRLGAGDVIQVTAVEAEEISKGPIRISSDGYINLPSVGRLKAADDTIEELQAAIAERLKRLIVDPDVTVSIVETHSQPVSVVGAVKTPGVYQLQGHKSLLEVLSMAGGPAQDAGYTIKITRQKEFGSLPLTHIATEGNGDYTVAQVNIQAVMDGRDPKSNILMMPNDIVNVPKAQMVYVLGDVLKPGSIVLGDQKTVTVLQAISVASGLGKTAKPTQAKILRLTPGSPRRSEIAVNLKTMLNGKGDDIDLRAEDILYVPTSLKKDLALKTLETLGGTGVASVLYRVP